MDEIFCDTVPYGARPVRVCSYTAHLEVENADLLTKLDDAIAWFEGDDSLRARLETENERLRHSLDAIRTLTKEKYARNEANEALGGE